MIGFLFIGVILDTISNKQQSDFASVEHSIFTFG